MLLKYLSAFLSLTVVLLFLNESVGEEKKDESVAPQKKTAKKVISRTVTATVETRSAVAAPGGADFQRAKKAPATFTIPKGYMAVGFQYNYYDPKSDRKWMKLGASSIYSVTEKRSISEAEDNKNLKLPPGQYRFIVGGYPGASGTLKFKLVPKDANEPDAPLEGNDKAVDHDLPRKFDVSYHDKDEKLLFPKTNPFVLRFSDGEVNAKWIKTETHSYPPITVVLRTEITVEGRSEKGRLRGKATLYFTQTTSGGEYNGALVKSWQYGDVTGNADSNGRLHVVLHYTDLKQLGHHSTKGWVDQTEQLKNLPNGWKPYKYEMVFQLPIKEKNK